MVPALENTLFSAGALSVILVDSSDQPVLEPEPGEIRLWDSLRVTGLFAQNESPSAILERCHACSEQPLPQYRFENLPDEDWVRTGTHPTTALCLAWLDGLHSGSAAQLRTADSHRLWLWLGCAGYSLCAARRQPRNRHRH